MFPFYGVSSETGGLVLLVVFASGGWGFEEVIAYRSSCVCRQALGNWYSRRPPSSTLTGVD